MEEGEAIAMSKRMIPKLQGNIDVTDPDSVNPQMIYVDNKLLLENELTIDDLLRMAD